MKLSDWLEQHWNDKTQGDFADAAGISQASVSRLLSGEQLPSMATVQAIYRVTGGQVSANDFFLADTAAE